ncbi:hypothetical protein I204_00340 [Kwoniella mangroviensis CBS 8886]|nr:hypothetical protein I204_00340 [Kwoniella mangroviensis CBS 8886]
MAQSPWDISMTGRSRTFPFNQMIPLAYTHPGYTISSERDQQHGITMGMGYQGLAYQSIGLPSSSMNQDRQTAWDISVLPQSIVPIDDNHNENHEEKVDEEETELDSDDEFDNHQRELSDRCKDIPVGVESEGTGSNGGIINIELSSSSISSSNSASPANDRTTVLALGEIASSQVASPQVGSVPGYRPYVPKSTHSPILLSTNSSSEYEYVEEEEEEEQEQVSRNGRYPTRLNTLKNQEKKKNNRKKVEKNKKDKRIVKGKGKGKVGCKKRSSTTYSSTSSYKATSTSSVNVSGGIGRKLGCGGAKVPTGAFLFWMMK